MNIKAKLRDSLAKYLLFPWEEQSSYFSIWNLVSLTVLCPQQSNKTIIAASISAAYDTFSSLKQMGQEDIDLQICKSKKLYLFQTSVLKSCYMPKQTYSFPAFYQKIKPMSDSRQHLGLEGVGAAGSLEVPNGFISMHVSPRPFAPSFHNRSTVSPP